MGIKIKTKFHVPYTKIITGFDNLISPKMK